MKFKEEYLKKKNQGYDLREAAWWIKEARKEYLGRNYKKAKEHLDKAFLALEKAEKIDFFFVRSSRNGMEHYRKASTILR